MAAALRNSVARLSADDAELLRALGSGFAREVNTAEAAALSGADPELIQDSLERLAEMHLLDEEATNRYVMSDLVKLFAQGDGSGRGETRAGLLARPVRGELRGVSARQSYGSRTAAAPDRLRTYRKASDTHSEAQVTD